MRGLRVTTRIVPYLLIALAASCSSESATVRQSRKQHLIDIIREKLLESVEAEKTAVLATTDDESQAAAGEAKSDESAVNTARGELRSLIAADARREEIEKLDAFDAAWGDLERLDERLLGLAVANTNLKATQLLSHDGSVALDRFVDGLSAMQHTITDPDLLRLVGGTSSAAFRTEGLLFAHIPSADEAEMTQLEQRIQDLRAQVDRALSTIRESRQVSPELFASTAAAWTEYQRLAAEVVRLSRQNSNVISFDVSVHQKRQATKRCLSALAELEGAVDVGPHAPR